MSLLEDQSVRSAELETSIRVLKKDIAEIEAERKAVLKARTAAQEAGDAAAVTALTEKSSQLLQEGTKAINQLSVYEEEKAPLDRNIYNIQKNQQDLAQQNKVPIPINTGSNPGGVPAGPTSTITEGNRNDPLPVTKASDPNLAQNAATTNEAAQDKKLPVDPNLAQNAATTNEAAQDKKLPVEPNLAQNAATTDQAAQDKKVPNDPAINNVQDAAAAAAATANQSAAENARLNKNTQSAIGAAKQATQSSATSQDVTNAAAQGDWRVRLSLAPGAQYLYLADTPGILAPLAATNGIIFPYTPSISVTYAANYDSVSLTHSNYKFQTYNSSAVDSITIGCDFTAQDAYEANYVLAVIHFFRSVTKMFYGQDPGPISGTPPPLCYLTGLGAFQFDQHPLLIQNFTYTLPTDVDYIAAGSTATQAGVSRSSSVPKGSPNANPSQDRMAGAGGIQKGAVPAPPNFSGAYAGTREPTYVPTKISLSITALPVVTRNDISNRFSLKDYATGALLRSSKTGALGGLW